VAVDFAADRSVPGPVRTIYQAFGVTFAVDLFDRNLVERIEALLPSAATAVERIVAPGPPTSTGAESSAEDEELAVYTLLAPRSGTFRVDQGDKEALTCSDLELALWTLGGLAREYVAFHATTGIFVRGASIVHENRAIVVIGPPLSGRTTLVAELIRAGASAWSDEYAVFDEDGHVGRFGVGSHSNGSPDQAGAAPLGMLVITSFRPGVEWSPSRLSDGESLLAMLAQAIPARERSALTMSVLRKAVTGTETLRGDRGEAQPAAEAILASASNAFASRPLFG
jgi:hypothetical protein